MVSCRAAGLRELKGTLHFRYSPLSLHFAHLRITRDKRKIARLAISPNFCFAPYFFKLVGSDFAA